MKLYSLEEIKYLKKFYYDKVIDKIVDEETGLRITSMEIKEYQKDSYDLSCSGYFINMSSIVPIISIQTIVSYLDIDSPDIVLQNRNL